MLLDIMLLVHDHEWTGPSRINNDDDDDDEKKKTHKKY